MEKSFDILKELEVLYVEETLVEEENDNLAKGLDDIVAQALVASPVSQLDSYSRHSFPKAYVVSPSIIVDPPDHVPLSSLAKLPQLVTHATNLTMDRLLMFPILEPDIAPSKATQKSVKILTKFWGDAIDEYYDPEGLPDASHNPLGNKFVSTKAHKKKTKQQYLKGPHVEGTNTR